MIVEKRGEYSIRKDGTQYYRVHKGRKRVASFLLLVDAKKYIEDKEVAR